YLQSGPHDFGRMKRLLEMSHKTHSATKLDEALQIILQEALAMTEMQRGFILLFNEKGFLDFSSGRDISGKPLHEADFEVSHSVIQRALKKERLFCFFHPSTPHSKSSERLGISSAFCVPLFACRSLSSEEDAREILGIFYVDSQKR